MGTSIISTFLLCPLAYLSWKLWPHIRQRITRWKTLASIAGPASPSFIVGHIDELFDSHTGWEFHRTLRQNYGSTVRVRTYFGGHALYTFDPSVVSQVLVRDSAIWHEPQFFTDAMKLLLGDSLLASHGERHRLQRKMLGPAFSAAHLREITPIFQEVVGRLEETFVKMTTRSPSQEIDVMPWMTRTAMELIAQAGIGLSFDSLAEDAIPHEYSIAVRNFVQTTENMASFQGIATPILVRLGPAWFRRFIIDHIPSDFIQGAKWNIDTMYNTSVQIFQDRKRALLSGNEVVKEDVTRGKDILSILLKANQIVDESERLSDEELLGQLNTFTFAATDTTSNSLCRILHLLSAHPDIQTKLREEIRTTKSNCGTDTLDYDTLSFQMPYLDAICRETLRVYPALQLVTRIAQEDSCLSLSTPVQGSSGEQITQVPIPKGTPVHISIVGSNRNTRLWGPDAEEWKPERWLQPLPDALVEAKIPGVYSHLLTFIAGNHACIGFKFSQLEMKTVLAHLVDKLEFSLPDREIVWKMSVIPTAWDWSKNQKTPSCPLFVKPAAV